MYKDVDEALLKQVADTATALGCKWSKINKPFDVSNKGELYLSPYILMIDNEPTAVNSNCTNRYRGILQIDIYARGGKGISKIYSAIDEIKTKFKRGTILTNNGQSVRLRRIETRAVQSSPDWYKQPIDVTFEAETIN